MRLRDRILRADLFPRTWARAARSSATGEELIDFTRAARRAVLTTSTAPFVAAVTRSRRYARGGRALEDAAPPCSFDLVAPGGHAPENDVASPTLWRHLVPPGHIADLRARAASSDDTVGRLQLARRSWPGRPVRASRRRSRSVGCCGTTTDEGVSGRRETLSVPVRAGVGLPLCVGFLTTIEQDGPSTRRPAWEPVHALAVENLHGTPEELTEALEARIEELGYKSRHVGRTACGSPRSRHRRQSGFYLVGARPG